VSDEKALAGPILSLVGGLVILIVAIVEIYAGELTNIQELINFGFVGAVFGFFIVVVAICGFAYWESHVAIGVLVILLAFPTLVSGVGVGFLLAVLGGTCSIVFGPEEVTLVPLPAAAAPVYATGPLAPTAPPKVAEPVPAADKDGRTHLGCPSCGTINPIPATVCISCGAKLRP
jgi:hypothetical protein